MEGPPDIRLSQNKTIGLNYPCLIVAEIGQNHQGDINIAEKLITTAKECGADVAKFQMSCLEEKFTKSALNREYNGPNSWGKTYGEHKRHLEFTREQYVRLQNYANSNDILFTASAMDVVSLDFLASLDPPFIKIGSGDNTNVLLLERAVNLNRPLVISTGMLDIDGVKNIYDICKGKCPVVLLHCVSSYPAPADSINLNVLESYKELFPEFHCGYSGHEENITISIAAVAKGAKVLERHVTLDKTWKGTDHSCSLDPQELKQLVQSVREVEMALGTSKKTFQKCETPCYMKLGKSIVAACDIQSGEVLDLNKIKIKVSQPKGLDPLKTKEILNRKVNKLIRQDEPITNKDIV